MQESGLAVVFASSLTVADGSEGRMGVAGAIFVSLGIILVNKFVLRELIVCEPKLLLTTGVVIMKNNMMAAATAIELRIQDILM